MAKYRLSENGVHLVEKNLNIPDDPANSDWLEYLEWLAEGNTPDPIPAPPPPPTDDELLDDLLQAQDQTRRILTAFIKAWAQYENIPLAQVRQAIRNNM